jgi:hypothetical protein
MRGGRSDLWREDRGDLHDGAPVGCRDNVTRGIHSRVGGDRLRSLPVAWASGLGWRVANSH